MDIEKLQKIRAQQSKTYKEQKQSSRLINAVNQSSSKTVETLNKSALAIARTNQQNAKLLENLTTEVQDGLDRVALALKNIAPEQSDYVKVVNSFVDLVARLETAAKTLSSSKLNELPNATNKLTKAIDGISANDKEEPDYTEAFASLQKAIEKIDVNPVVKVPAAKPVDLSPLQDVVDQLKSLEKAVKAQKQTIDLSPVMDGLDQLNTTFRSIKIPVPNFIQDPFIRYKAADEYDDGVSTNVKYYGFVDPEGHWYIIKNDPSSNPKTYRYAFGSNNYATNWSNRASLTYDLPFIGFP